MFGQVLTSLNARRQTIKRYREEIEDFLGWNADEAKFRIVGNIKRLNRLGITDINLRGAHLKKVDLKRANLQGADLIDANLEEANLCESNLKGANLWRINLKGANLWMAKLQGANLQFANLEEANLCGANLQKTVLKNAYMQKSFLLDTNLSAAFLYVADLSDARLDTTTILKGARYNTERIELKAWSESSKYKSGNYILFPTKWQVPDPKAVGAQEDNEGNCLK